MPKHALVPIIVENVRGAVGAASTVASTAVSAAATTVGFLTKLPMIGEQSGGKTPSEESTKSAAGDHSPPSPSDSEHSTTKTSSLTAAREKRKWESLRAVGNPMIQTVCFVLTMLAGLLMIALLAYMLLGTQDKSKSAAAQVHRPTVTADPDDVTPWFPLPPTDNPTSQPNATDAE
ncbi:hypothetical protein MTO96_049476 [Rhipicephalus appendiculatus]